MSGTIDTFRNQFDYELWDTASIKNTFHTARGSNPDLISKKTPKTPRNPKSFLRFWLENSLDDIQMLAFQVSKTPRTGGGRNQQQPPTKPHVASSNSSISRHYATSHCFNSRNSALMGDSEIQEAGVAASVTGDDEDSTATQRRERENLRQRFGKKQD